MSKTLSLSIVIPACNEEGYLKACLESIAAQKVAPSQVIVVDNNSSDKTSQIALSYPFVKLIREPKQGIVYARNRGFNAATTDLIGRIDADTRLSANWVEQALNFFTDHSEVAACGGDLYFYDFPLKRVGHFFFNLIYYDIQSLLAGTNIMLGANMVIRRRAWLQVAGLCHEDSDIAEDIDLSLNLGRAGLRVGRPIKLMVEASMLRHQFSPLNIIKYLSRWPKTYARNQKPMAAALCYLIKIVIAAAAFVLYPVFLAAVRKRAY
ncbi:TPA: hypothetical protein DIS56_02835 [Candidatus Saccharibacteria bacterium]|nr:MAG: putative glycosyltransferase [Candidatus Saccharibacteria bacterium GW2011_GWA2_46_10]OGL35862.1 MAG: hypothetical protein A3F05_00790 [Candidatus Saccharibacteria bacterium RIFCSPHIGHO2_12_FULL_47_17]HCM52043.1 hypothetical protein [Candidatus Saccharibacteria bacterium]